MIPKGMPPNQDIPFMGIKYNNPMKTEITLEKALRTSTQWHFIGKFKGEVCKDIKMTGLTHLVKICDGYRLDNLSIGFTFDSKDQVDNMINELNKFKDFLEVHKHCLPPYKWEKNQIK